jgi:hypothetical protein
MTWAAYGPPWAAYGPRNPSADGFRWHDVSEDVKKPADVLAGQRPISAAHDKRPQQDSNLRSRLRRRQTTSFEFMHPACSDSIAHVPDGQGHSAHVPDHGYFRRDRPHLGGDGPRPVRAGSGLALGF